MIIQNRDGSLVCDGGPEQPLNVRKSLYAEVPSRTLDEQSSLVERLINFAFDALGARHLEVRVHDAE